MRKFQYCEPVGSSNKVSGDFVRYDLVITVSESWLYWLFTKRRKEGVLEAPAMYFETYIDNWIIVNWAWELK